MGSENNDFKSLLSCRVRAFSWRGILSVVKRQNGLLKAFISGIRLLSCFPHYPGTRSGSGQECGSPADTICRAVSKLNPVWPPEPDRHRYEVRSGLHCRGV